MFEMLTKDTVVIFAWVAVITVLQRMCILGKCLLVIDIVAYSVVLSVFGQFFAPTATPNSLYPYNIRTEVLKQRPEF